MAAIPSFGSASALATAVLGMVACGLDWTVPAGESGTGASGGLASGGSTTTSSGGSAVASTGGSTGFAAGGSPSQGGAGGGMGASGGAGAGTASSTGTGQPMCDMAASCVACDDCSIDRGCHTEYLACDADPDCYDLGSCVYSECADFGDVPCINNCYFFNPAGGDLFDAFATCVVCDECDNTCSDYQTWWGCQ